MLQLFNSLTRQKEVFEPIQPDKVRMYVCGITVYDDCHIGHARMLVAFDMVYRYLQHKGFEVTYVRNITDIDDKIIQRAHESGQTIQSLTEHYIKSMHEDTQALGLLNPSFEPRATHHMQRIISMIQTLIEKGAAYLADNHDVYYAVKTFADYGQLSGKNIDDLQVGARVEVDQHKRDPLDFVLWKSAKPEEPHWESPWGPGRPGWHIECSAMSEAFLGEHFDIHGGGLDLQFPHHENEIAQSEACHGHQYVNYWLHNGFVRINNEKMSKSLDNFFTIKDVLKSYRPEEIRYFILASHYRSPLNYSDEQLDIARASLTRLYTALRDIEATMTDVSPDLAIYQHRFTSAMDDDLNTSEAIAVLFDLSHQLNTQRDQRDSQASQTAGLLKHLAGILGLLQQDPTTFLQSATGSEEQMMDDAAIQRLVSQREQARQDKDWSKSDELRDQLIDAGISLEDTPQGTVWKRG